MRLALDIFAGSTLVGGRVMLPAAAAAAIGALSPAAQCGAERMDPVAWR
jgi:hypothetical protein